MRPTVLFISLILLSISSTFAAPESLDSQLMERIRQNTSPTLDRAKLNAITNNGIKNLALNRSLVVKHNPLMNLTLKKSGITNQKSSGRCWLFAGLNVFNPSIMTSLKLTKFELSEPYLAFWDKMEKANLFLEDIIELRDKPLDDRRLRIVLESPFGDGGWWHYMTDLMDKYGVVPISAMPETKQSSSTGQINKLANRKLRAFASELRAMHTDGSSVEMLRQKKEAMLSEIYKLLAYGYGEPPTSFVFRYENKDSTLSTPETYSPKSFYKEFFDGELPEYATLMDNPTLPYEQLFEMESSSNMADHPDMRMLNMPISRLKEYALATLKDSQVVWFACDVGKENYSDSGIFAVGIYDYQSTFDIDFGISKKDRIDYGDSNPNHAMVLMGVDTTTDGTPTKWLVQNSWGKKRGDDGFWYMYDDWFDEYVYFVIVEEDRLIKSDRKKMQMDPVVLPPWDPFFQSFKNSQFDR